MVEINEDGDGGLFNVPIEATAFLAAVSALAVILLIFVMYVNKKFRFFNVSVETEAKSVPKSHVSPAAQNVIPIPLSVKLRTGLGGDAYSATPESSSDSEEDVLRRLRQHSQIPHVPLQTTSVVSNSYQQQHTSLQQMRSLDKTPQHHLPPRNAYQYSKLHQLHQHRSLDLGPSSSHLSSYTRHPASHDGRNSPAEPMSNISTSGRSGHSTGGGSSGSQFTGQSMRPLRVTMIRDVHNESSSGNGGTSLPSSSSRRRAQYRGISRSATLGGRNGQDGSDLISLAEKGKVCGGSSASSTSSNVSAADMEELHRQHPGRPLGLQTRPHHQHRHLPHQPHSTESQSSGPSFPHHLLQRSTSRDREPRELNPPISRPHPLTLPPSSLSSQQNHFRRMMLPPRTKSMDSESPPPSEQGLSTYGDSIADQDDHIFEVEEMSIAEGELGMIVETSRDSSSAVPCGSVEVAFDYEAAARKMTIHVIQGRGIPPKDVGGADNTQIRVVLLPSRKSRQKTKVRPGENPQYLESFVFSKINPEDVSSLGIRLRLYGCERMRRERLLGECVLGFASLHLELETTLWLNFEPRYHLSWDSHSETGSIARSESASSTQSIQNGIPELLVGLAYNGTTGRLTVEIIKGSHFRNLAGGKAPDSYVKLVLVSCNSQEMGRAKSSLRRSQSNPLFKETFMFQVALFQVSEVTLLVSIYGRKGVTRRELLGWFSLGYNSSGDEETTHWEDMCDAQGDQMCRWHVLLQS